MLELVPEQRVVLRNCSWETYERILAEHTDQSAPRFTYDRGDLEVMSPSPPHERANLFLALLIFEACAELGLDAYGLGSTTQRDARLEKGVEPDSSFAFSNSNHPDIAIEIEVSRAAIDKLPICAALGIAEVWRYDLKKLTFLRLVEGTYQPIERRAFLPFTSQELSELLAQAGERSHTAWIRHVRAWLKSR